MRVPAHLALFLWFAAAIPLPAQENAAPINYPAFSWERIPQYMHIRKSTSFTEKEIAFLARFPLITFEKANGHEDHGSVEKGTLAAAKAVKQINPNTKILYYRNVIVHYGSYDANTALKDIPNALLSDAEGNTKLVRNRVQAYDLSTPGLRDWWVKSCQQVVADPAIDGLFLDGNIKALEPGYLARQIGKAKKKQTMAGYHLLLKETRKALGPKKLMVANILRARFPQAGFEYIDAFDGAYLEGFFHNVGKVGYEEYVAKGIAVMQKAARTGKIIAYTATLSETVNTSRMGIDEAHGKAASEEEARRQLYYKLAVFLVCAEKYSYVRIHEGYSANEGEGWMRWFPEYDRPLGPPQGPATRKGHVYTRAFKHVDVWLDVKKREGRITWK